MTIERACERSWAKAFSPKVVPISHTIQASQAILRFTKPLRFDNFEYRIHKDVNARPANSILHQAARQARFAIGNREPDFNSLQQLLP
jgi:hypothetical protein